MSGAWLLKSFWCSGKFCTLSLFASYIGKVFVADALCRLSPKILTLGSVASCQISLDIFYLVQRKADWCSSFSVWWKALSLSVLCFYTAIKSHILYYILPRNLLTFHIICNTFYSQCYRAILHTGGFSAIFFCCLGKICDGSFCSARCST